MTASWALKAQSALQALRRWHQSPMSGPTSVDVVVVRSWWPKVLEEFTGRSGFLLLLRTAGQNSCEPWLRPTRSGSLSFSCYEDPDHRGLRAVKAYWLSCVLSFSFFYYQNKRIKKKKNWQPGPTASSSLLSSWQLRSTSVSSLDVERCYEDKDKDDGSFLQDRFSYWEFFYMKIYWIRRKLHLWPSAWGAHEPWGLMGSQVNGGLTAFSRSCGLTQVTEDRPQAQEEERCSHQDELWRLVTSGSKTKTNKRREPEDLKALTRAHQKKVFCYLENIWLNLHSFKGKSIINLLFLLFLGYLLYRIISLYKKKVIDP